MTHFQDGKERITCTGGSLDGRELWIAKGLQRFKVLGHGGTKESYFRDGQRFVMAGEIAGSTLILPAKIRISKPGVINRS